MSSFEKVSIPQSVWRDDGDLLRAQQPVRDDERAQRVLGHKTAGIPDHVCVALSSPRHLRRVEPASMHVTIASCRPGGMGRSPFVEAVRVDLVRSLQDVALRHGSPSL